MDLPEELWMHIFSYLNKLDLMVISAVCRPWNHLSNSDSVWRALLKLEGINCTVGSAKVLEKFNGPKNLSKFCHNTVVCPTFPLLGGLPFSLKLTPPVFCLMFWIYLESSCTGHLRLFLRDKSFYLGVASHCNQLVWAEASWQSYSQRSSNWYASASELPVRVWTHVALMLRPGSNQPPMIFFAGKPVGGRPARPASMTLRGSKYATGQLCDIRAFTLQKKMKSNSVSSKDEESSEEMSTSSSIAADEDLEEIRRASSSSSSSSLRHHWPSSLLASSPPGGGRLLTKCSTTSNSPTSAELLHSQCQALLPLICASAPRVTFTMQEEMHNSEARPLPLQHSQKCSQCGATPIPGILYSCIECTHFLCESCFAAPQTRRRGAMDPEHTPDHSFQPYRLPIQ